MLGDGCKNKEIANDRMIDTLPYIMLHLKEVVVEIAFSLVIIDEAPA